MGRGREERAMGKEARGMGGGGEIERQGRGWGGGKADDVKERKKGGWECGDGNDNVTAGRRGKEEKWRG